jgi:uncharacterized protein YndB with AHSA1/START domain
MIETAISTTVSITILKPAAEVFQAVLKPVPYFVARASAPMAAGYDVIWNFPEMATDVPVTVESVVPNELIRFKWDAEGGGKNSCEFRFSPLDDQGRSAAKKLGIAPEPATTVTVTESGWPDTPEGRKGSLQNTMGWTQMLCALKAWLEHGVNLRHGAFLHFRFP